MLHQPRKLPIYCTINYGILTTVAQLTQTHSHILEYESLDKWDF